MTPFALLFGGLLVALGYLGYAQPGTFGEGPEKQPTALIPAYIGAVIVLAGLLTALLPALRKHTMHLAALAGVLGAIGGFVPIVKSNFDFAKASAVVGMLMTGLCAVFTLLCVRSFIAARKARAAA